MSKNTGSNTNDQSEERDTTVTYVIETEQPSDQYTIPEDIASAQINSNEDEPTSFESEQPLPIDSIIAANIPWPILQSIKSAVCKSHFILIAPNTSAALVTRESIADLPPGYIVCLVFDEAPPALLPTNHQDGKAYIVK